MHVILINGKSGSGKNTVANILYDYYTKTRGENKVAVVENSSEVKRRLKSLYNWNGVKDSEGKRMLRELTHFGYSVDKHYWEKYTKEFVESFEYVNKVDLDFLIVPDWRYKTTYDYFSKFYHVTTILVESHNLETVDGSTLKDDRGQLENFNFDIEIHNEHLEDEEEGKKYLKEVTLCAISSIY